MEVKKIAWIVASIVVIGFVVALFTGGWLTDVIDQVWEWIWTSITSWFS